MTEINMDPHIEEKADTAASAPAPITLEAVEVELALNMQDILADGFEGALRKAADIVHGEILFNMPAPADHYAQRIGAIAVPNGSVDQVVFVTLARDGTTLAVSSEDERNASFKSLGQNLAAIMRGLKTPENEER
ncbi:MAG: hypothetical protein ACRECW_02680 [Phyllobacterium sp.]